MTTRRGGELEESAGLPEDSDTRRRLREMRLETAREGKQTPLVIDCPWLYSELARPVTAKN